MLALERGGSCAGLAFRIPGPDVADQMMSVWRREMAGAGYRARWLRLKTENGAVQALGFVVNKQSPRFAGRLAHDVVADYIARACGASGPSAEYLLETHNRCLALGIRDDMLDRLQAMVAKRLREFAQNQ
jgi:cation transport protein ChaC